MNIEEGKTPKLRNVFIMDLYANERRIDWVQLLRCEGIMIETKLRRRFSGKDLGTFYYEFVYFTLPAWMMGRPLEVKCKTGKYICYSDLLEGSIELNMN